LYPTSLLDILGLFLTFLYRTDFIHKCTYEVIKGQNLERFIQMEISEFIGVLKFPAATRSKTNIFLAKQREDLSIFLFPPNTNNTSLLFNLNEKFTEEELKEHSNVGGGANLSTNVAGKCVSQNCL